MIMQPLGVLESSLAINAVAVHLLRDTTLQND